MLSGVSGTEDEPRAGSGIDPVRARYEREIRRRESALRVLGEVTRAAVAAPSPRTAIAAALRIVCERNAWQIGHAWLTDDEGHLVSSGIWHAERGRDDGPLRALSADVSVAPGEGFVGRVAERRAPLHDDDLRDRDDWTHGTAAALGMRACVGFPVLVEGEVEGVLEFFHAAPLEREPFFMDVMDDVGMQIGQAIQRDRLERLISEQSDRERQTLARQVHDNLGQQLTAIGMLATRLARGLSDGGSELSATAERLVRAVDDSKTQVRGLAKGLLPLAVGAGGIVDALRDLVAATEPAYPEIAIRFEHDGDVRVEDEYVATQLYRIAQEALYNATQHADPDRVTIRLRAGGEAAELEVRDDGTGMPSRPPRGSGSGLRIMRHRARLLGGDLSIESRPGGGTSIRCRAPVGGSPRRRRRRL